MPARAAPLHRNSRYSMLLSPDELAPLLLAWYDTVHANRDMPWRQTRDPYAIWLSETMLQQTQVETVKPYYSRFLQQFPTVADLAAADLDAVLALWAGLGYYRRARHLHAAARQIVSEHGGRLPASIEALLALPGVGRYTAGAVASIAFNLPAPVVDGNVMRVLARLTAFDKNIGDPKNAPFFWQTAETLVEGATGGGGGNSRPPASWSQSKTTRNKRLAIASPPSMKNPRYGDLNQSLMELGATVCLPPPAQPTCLLCPVRAACRAFAEGRQNELPMKEKRRPTPELHHIALVLLRTTPGAEVLLFRRPSTGVWAGMWEFPLIEGALGSSPDLAALQSRMQKLLGLRLKDVAPAGKVTHHLTHRTMHFDILTAATSDRHLPQPPPCHEGGPYAEPRWLPWPLPRHPHPPTPLARVVHRIAQSASEHFAGGRPSSRPVPR